MQLGFAFTLSKVQVRTLENVTWGSGLLHSKGSSRQDGWTMLAKSQQVLCFDLHPTTASADWPWACYLSSLYLSFYQMMK